MPKFVDGRNIRIDFSREVEAFGEKLKALIEANLMDLLEQIDFFEVDKTSGEKRIVGRFRSIKEPRFKFDQPRGKGQGAGQLGEGEDGKEKAGIGFLTCFYK